MTVDWRDRLVNEFALVDARLNRLREFIFSGSEFEKLEDEDKRLLQLQEIAMGEYLEILSERIGRLARRSGE